MGGPDLSNPLGMTWLQPLTEVERSRIIFSEAGEMLDVGDWYVDATSPKRGPVLALEGEFVPKQGLYIRRSKVGEDLWGRVTLAASGKL